MAVYQCGITPDKPTNDAVSTRSWCHISRISSVSGSFLIIVLYFVACCIRNVGKSLQCHTVSQPRRPQSNLHRHEHLKSNCSSFVLLNISLLIRLCVIYADCMSRRAKNHISLHLYSRREVKDTLFLGVGRKSII
jgi:hypothetical protein